MLKSVLSVGNQEQNFFYPPRIFSDQFNTVTSLLLSALVKTYPVGIDMIRPFLIRKRAAVKNGYVELEDNYRNFLSAGINAKKDGTGECGEKEVVIDTEQEFKLSGLKSDCKSVAIEFVSNKEWDYRTSSTYKFPTYETPIGCFLDANKFKVCPYDLATVDVRYVRQENVYRYGYITQPDDTYIFDKSTTVESEWTSAAFDKIFPAMVSLYAAYSRDPSLTDWSRVLHNEGIL